MTDNSPSVNPAERARRYALQVREAQAGLQGHTPRLLHPDRVIHLIEDAYAAGLAAAAEEAAE